MLVKISKSLTYVPEFNGNKKADPADQIIVHYKNPTYSLKEKIKGQAETKARADVNGNIQGIDISFKSNDIATLRGLLERIDNCQFEDENGTVKTISNVQELLDAPVEFAPLVEELIEEFNKTLNKKVEEKN